MLRYRSVTPCLCLDDADTAVDFYGHVFAATERLRLRNRDGRTSHAEMALGGGAIVLREQCPELGLVGPHLLGGTPVTMRIYVPHIGTVVERALAAGAALLGPTGVRGAPAVHLEDPFGHRWVVASRPAVATAAAGAAPDVSTRREERRLRSAAQGGKAQPGISR